MFNLIGQMINLTWKVMSFTLIVNVFWALMKSGRDTIRDFRDTLVMAIRVGIQKLQRWLFAKYKEQSGTTENKES